MLPYRSTRGERNWKQLIYEKCCLFFKQISSSASFTFLWRYRACREAVHVRESPKPTFCVRISLGKIEKLVNQSKAACLHRQKPLPNRRGIQANNIFSSLLEKKHFSARCQTGLVRVLSCFANVEKFFRFMILWSVGRSA